MERVISEKISESNPYKETAQAFYEQETCYNQRKRRHYRWIYSYHFRQEEYPGRDGEENPYYIIHYDLLSVEMRVYYVACLDKYQAYRSYKQNIDAKYRVDLGYAKDVKIDDNAHRKKSESCYVAYNHAVKTSKGIFKAFALMNINS